jgi:hypothetical protein
VTLTSHPATSEQVTWFPAMGFSDSFIAAHRYDHSLTISFTMDSDRTMGYTFTPVGTN